MLRQKVEQIARKLTFLQQNKEFSYFSWSGAGFGAESDPELEWSGSDIFLVGAESERSGLEMRGAGAERERERVGAAHL